LPEKGKAERILQDHQRVLDAIVAGDAMLAQQALREHLSGTLSQVDDICKRYPDYVRA
jgi:DNA-binding GntR family transcriptional regulator